MPLEVPILDDRSWAALVEESRALIARFAPSWTDHNAHDPGVTFIELFAWLTEMQNYRLDRVSGRQLEGFARLAGIPRRGRAPARVEIELTGLPSDAVVVSEMAQLAPLDVDGVVFEPVAPTQLTRSRLLRVMVDDAEIVTDRTEANGSGVAFLAFGERAALGASLRLGFDAFHPYPERDLHVSFEVVTEDLSATCDPEAAMGEDAGAGRDPATAPVALVWETMASDQRWIPLTSWYDGTGALTRSGVVTIATPSAGARRDGCVWIRCRIAGGRYDVEPRLRAVRLNVLMCVQHETIEETIELDRRAGLPDQVVSLSRSPVLVSTEPDDPLPTIELKVGQDTWQMVESFDESGPADRHFMLDPELGTVTFGNGLNGRIPTSSSRTLEAKYRTSEGSRGNLASDLRWIFRKGGVGGVGLVNPNPATGGADSESLDELQLRAQASLNHSQRGVTERDLERMALGAPGVYVARAKAIADCPRRGAITVVVVPKVRPGRVGPPVDPSEAFLDAVQRHVEKLRLICDDVRVRGPAYVEVTVSARLRLLPGAGAGEPTIVRARRALDLFFATGETAPSADGGGPPSACPTRWPFGRSVFVSEVCAVLDGVPGVDAASDVLLSASLGGQAIQPDASRSIPIPGAGLVFGGAHRITVAAAARRTA